MLIHSTKKFTPHQMVRGRPSTLRLRSGLRAGLLGDSLVLDSCNLEVPELNGREMLFAKLFGSPNDFQI